MLLKGEIASIWIFGRDEDDTLPLAEIHPRIVLLQQALLRREIERRRNRRQALAGTERVGLKQPVIRRHTRVPARAIDGNIDVNAGGDIVSGIAVDGGERVGRGEVSIVVGGDFGVGVAGAREEGEVSGEILAGEALAGEEDVDASVGDDGILVGDFALVVGEDLGVGGVEEGGDVGEVKGDANFG